MISLRNPQLPLKSGDFFVRGKEREKEKGKVRKALYTVLVVVIVLFIVPH